MTRRQAIWIALLLFVAAVLLRLPHLNSFLTPDEQRIWTTLTAQFLVALLGHDWAATATSGYPGVTTTYAGSLGLALQWLLARPAGITTLASMAEALLADPARLDMLLWLRLGVALTSAAGMALIFGLVRRLFDDATALLAAGLLLFDPFLLAHSRLLNTDPLLALALTISWLALVIGAADGRRPYLALAGGAFGLAVLTKTPALLVTPLVVVWVFWQQGRRQPTARRWLVAGAADLTWFALSAALTVLVLWPALWVAPVSALRRSVEFAVALGQVGHELGNFWLGEPVEGPSVLFYPAVALWRSTAVTLIGLALALLALLSPVRRSASAPSPRPAASSSKSSAWALLLFVLWVGAAMSLSPKKFDRYLLPAFPALAILAAWGWVRAVRWLATGRRGRQTPRAIGSRGRARSPAAPGLLLAGLVLVGLQASAALAALPTYLPAYNPLLGGIRTAQKVMLVGWGEGLEQAAAYLNKQPSPEDTRVAAWYGANVFAPFFRGQSYDVYYELTTAADLYANDVDFVVTYINQRQRGLLDDSIQEFLGEPVMSSEWQGVPLAQVFAWPKPFDHTTDRELAPGLRLLGWTVGPLDAAARQLPVTLYWDAATAAAQSSALLPVTVWLKDAAGEVWANDRRGWTAGQEAATAGWLGRPVIRQELVLSLPAGLLAGRYRLEMAPEVGLGAELGAVNVPATGLASVTDVAATPLPARVLFGDMVQLLAYDLRQETGGWALDLLWAAQGPPPEDAHYFVHALDATGAIVAQQDGVLAAPPGQSLAAWREGEIVRQRIRLPAVPAPTSVVVGLYRGEDGQRWPLTVDGQPVADGRYPVPVELAP